MSPFEQAVKTFEGGRVSEAEVLCRQLLLDEPATVKGRLLLAEIAARTGRMPLASTLLREALQIEPDSYGALLGLANVHRSTGEAVEAVALLERAIQTRPEVIVAYDLLGSVLLGQRRFPEAAEAFQSAVDRSPSHPLLYRNLGIALSQSGRLAEAEPAFRRAVALAPEEAVFASDLGQLMLLRGEMAEAVAQFRTAVRLAPEASQYPMLLGQALIEQGELSEAEDCLRLAIAMDAGNAGAHAALGALLKQLGRFGQAEESLAKAIDLQTENGAAYLEYVNGKRIEESDRFLTERMLTMAGSRRPDLRQIHYALGKAFDDLGSYGDAMRHFDEANRIAAAEDRAAGRVFDREALVARIDGIIERFSRKRIESFVVPAATDRPLFVVGMVRSGTTLVEQIISNHRDVAAGGELPFWTERAQAIDQTHRGDLSGVLPEVRREYLEILRQIDGAMAHVTDKMPGNFVALGLMHLAFPGSRMVACRRNPADNALSIYTTAFRTGHAYVNDREDIVFFYRQFARLMEHWQSVLPAERFLQVEYEEVVRDREAVTRRILDFCGLDWDPACLTPETNERPVKTPSQWQVRQPVYATSVERWRNYEPWLGPFRSLV